ncbi:MAG TPA: diaminopimelate epimerase [Lachnospiraceae bacterium]
MSITSIKMSKYQGLGNDYIVIDPNKNQTQLRGKKIALLCERSFGIGADGVLYGPILKEGKIYVNIYNADGSQTQASGNGIRIFAKYLMDEQYVNGKQFEIYTEKGLFCVEALNDRGTEFRVGMGKASFWSEDIPVVGKVREVVDEVFSFNEKNYRATCLSMGNPHCVILSENVTKEEVKKLGPYVENAEIFPHRMNLQLMKVIDRHNIKIEIYERGVGYTLASGTGSCAAVATARRLGLVDKEVNVHQPGGSIEISLREDGEIYMTGSVEFVADLSVAESFLA